MSAAAVIYVTSLESMSRFYAELFGLRAAESADGYCVLVSDSVKLSLVAAPDARRTMPLERPPRRRVNTPIKLAFEVADIALARATAASLGGQIDASAAEWSFGGLTHCDGVDPEGNVIQLVSPERLRAR